MVEGKGSTLTIVFSSFKFKKKIILGWLSFKGDFSQEKNFGK